MAAGIGVEAAMDDFICINCVSDEGLRTFIDSNASEEHCSYCGQEADDLIAVPIEDFLQYVEESIFREYDDAANCLPYESKEGGYLGATVYEGYDLVEELQIDFPKDNSGNLFDVVAGHLSDRVWCEADPFRLNVGQVARFSWDKFSEIVKHERRYYFYSRAQDEMGDEELLLPAELLKVVLDFAEHEDLIRNAEPGMVLFRVRKHGPDGPWTTPSDLGPPPVEVAVQSNRMSPAGVVMFYGSDSLEAALKETESGAGEYSIGEFRTLKELNLLDISELPPIPTLFEAIPDAAEVDPRHTSIFLHHIARQISLPIVRDDRVHVEYVPTQVVSEFIRSQGSLGGPQIDGIRYRSAVAPDDVSCVLFATRENVAGALPDDEFRFEDPDLWLELANTSEETLTEEVLTGWRAAVDDRNWHE